MTEKMSQLETNMRTHVDEKVSELSKDINLLRSEVTYINGQLSIIKWAIIIFGAPILVGFIINYLQNRKNKAKVDTVNQITENSTDVADFLE